MAAKGYAVDVFEKNNYPGGKLSEFYINGYRFDAGPSLFTMPKFVEELFELCGEKATNYFTYEQLNDLCHYFYEDGTAFITKSDSIETAEIIEKHTGEKKESILTFLNHSKRLYELTADVFIYNSFSDWKTFINPKFFKSLLYFRQLKTNQLMADAIQTYFTTPHVNQLFNRYATYNGSNPYKAPATLNVIPHLEYNIGAYLPTKGMVDITNSLVQLGERNGVKYHYNAEVTKILHDTTSISGIEVNGEIKTYDYVISDMDIYPLYHKLLKDIPKPTQILKQERSSSALVFNWGIKKSFVELGLHNILFSSDYRKEFEHLFTHRTIIDDPTIYIFISSKNIPTDAPKGCENWFTMINVPENNGQDWDSFIKEARHHIIRKINRILKTDIEKYIEVEEVLDPRLIESKTSSFGGSLYGNSSNNKWAAFLRHANKSSKLKNLYLVGGSVHPGGGIPLCLSSAKIVSTYFKKI